MFPLVHMYPPTLLVLGDKRQEGKIKISTRVNSGDYFPNSPLFLSFPRRALTSLISRQASSVGPVESRVCVPGPAPVGPTLVLRAWAPGWALGSAGWAEGTWSVTCRGVCTWGLIWGTEVCGWGPWDDGWTWCLLDRVLGFLLTGWVLGLLGGTEESLVRPSHSRSRGLSKCLSPHRGPKVVFQTRRVRADALTLVRSDGLVLGGRCP